MKRSPGRALALVVLLLFGYGAWTTVRIAQLQARLARLEASHETLARCTYDFGAELMGLNDTQKSFGWHWATVALKQMSQDDLMRQALARPRVEVISAPNPMTHRNGVEHVLQ